MDLSEEQIERLRKKLAEAKTYDDLMGKDGASKDLLSSALTEMLDAELTAHLGYDKHSPAGRNTGNSRNGTTKKSVKTEHGPIELPVPRDREGTFEPVIIKYISAVSASLRIKSSLSMSVGCLLARSARRLRNSTEWNSVCRRSRRSPIGS